MNIPYLFLTYNINLNFILMKYNYVKLLLCVAILMSSISYAQKQPTTFIKLDKSTNYSLQNAKQIIKENLKMSTKDNLIKIKTEKDKLGFTHEKYQQTFKGIKVEFGTYTVHAKNGSIKSMNGELFSTKEINTTPSISKQTALNRAIAYVGAEKYMWEEKNVFNYTKPRGELVILPAIKGNTAKSKLVYKYDIYADAPLYRANVYVDAHTGEVVFENKKIHHANTPATGTSLYNGTVSFTADSFNGSYRLRQTADGNGIQTFDMNNGTNYGSASEVTSNSASFTNAATAVQAHWGAEKTHKYYVQKHARNSYDNNGAIIKSYVSYRSNYVNAFWNGNVMTYGDGDGTNYGPLVSLDIVGHEITHGVTERSANLVYSYESGALNESFSDIFGESIENFGQGNNDWLMGEQIGAGGSGGALRSMSNPNTYGDPDTYQGTNWATGSADNGGVHTNSGVQNFWYYILSVGKSGTNDNGDAYTVSGIGMDKAGKIAYRNLTVYLSSNSNYAAARTGAIQAAVDLYGAGSAEEIATTNAWYAVGVGAAYGGGGGGSSYCTSKSTNINDEYIGRVKLNTINNASSGQFYSDFTSISTTLSKGSAYTITITPTWTGTVYNEGYAVWIDYNGDGDFADSGELVWSKSASKTTPVSGTFTVPSSVSATTTRMRVSMKYNATPSACETFTYGEVEDYTINFGGGSSCVATNLKFIFDNYPEETSWDIKNGSGTVVASGGTYASQADGSTLNIANCLPVGCYTLTVKDSYGDGMCCSYGNGSFTLTGGGTTLASGGSFSSSSTNSFCVGTGITEFANNNSNNETLVDEVTIYPNPAKEIISISLRDQKMNQYLITNMMGQIVSKGTVAEKNIRISNLKEGVYFIEFSSDKKRIIKRFIKK